jgi:curved DNA-binding protein CbpA
MEASEEVSESEPPPQEDKLPDTKAKYLQDLYRRLAKRYHPDKATDAEEEERREQLMPLVNRAYHEQDIETLERLSLGETERYVSEKTAPEKRVALRAELRQLNRAMSELRLEINRLKTGRTYQLKQQIENAKAKGSDLLTGLAKDLERRVKTSRAHLARLINMWHRAQ